MHSDSDQASRSFDTVREPEDSAVRPRQPPHITNSQSGQKYHNMGAAHRHSMVDTSNHKQSTGDDDDMSPRFLTGKENANISNFSYAKQNKSSKHLSRSKVSGQTEHSILMSLPREDLIELVLNTRKQLKQYIQLLDDKDAKMARLKAKSQELSEQLERISSNNQKLIEYIRQQQTERSEGVNRSNSSTKHRKAQSTRVHVSSSIKSSPEHEQQSNAATSQLMALTHSESPDQLLSKVRTLKQSSKFVCSLYKLIDQYTQDKYFNAAYSLSSAWSFVKKLFKEYFDESWMYGFILSRKSNSVVVQLQQLLNCSREDLNGRVLNMMRDMSRLNRLVQRFKLDCGLFWINDLDELERHLENRDRRHTRPDQ